MAGRVVFALWRVFISREEYHIDQARYYSTDPLRASVSAYAGAPDPLVRPDYTGAAPNKPGASTATALDAAVAHHAEASGENLAQLATTSEASLEGSSRTGSTVAASPVTVSTRQTPSPFAQRYLSDNSVRHDPVVAQIEGDLMKRMTATEAQKRFGRLLDTVKVEPVVIEKRGSRGHCFSVS